MNVILDRIAKALETLVENDKERLKLTKNLDENQQENIRKIEGSLRDALTLHHGISERLEIQEERIQDIGKHLGFIKPEEGTSKH